MEQTARINKYLPFAVLYFFFNSFLLPHGLMYTTLLTPVFLLWLYRYPSFHFLLYFFIVTIPFAIVHLLNGVDVLLYGKSYLLFFSVFVFGLAFYQFLKNCKTLPALFRSVLYINIVFVAFAVLILFVPFLKDRFWYNNAITTGINTFYRLKLLTYEPSYYSILLLPIALYYYLKMLLLKLPGKLLAFLLVTIPLLLSLSFGIIFGLALTFAFLFLSDVKLLFLKRRFVFYLISALVAVLLVFLVMLVLFPNNVLFLRLMNILTGRDISFNGRTADSFYLGWKIAAQKSILFGAGPGQVKPIGLPFFIEFYNYTNFTVNDVGIPNSLGDTLAVYGLLGVFIKLGLEIWFFFKTSVYQNFYRLALFLFVFIYQFTGSFITNIAEYVIWIMAFSPWIFTEFDKARVFGTSLQPDQATGNLQQLATLQKQ